MGKRPAVIVAVVFLVAGVAAAALFFSGSFISSAVQNPTISIDMVPADNAYDASANSMTVGAIDDCLTSATADAATHTHTAHLIIENVEDLVAWQVRFNYVGDRMRIASFDADPFPDDVRGQTVGFINLPIDQATGTHRNVVDSRNIPPAPVDGSNTAQTAGIGAVYEGGQNFPISPDTPAKSPPDDSSYSAPNGGILASVRLEVVGDESGNPSLFMNLDDGFPNPAGSGVAIFTGSGTQARNLMPEQLRDGYHGEGATCMPLDCTTVECPAVPTPTPGPTHAPPLPCTPDTATPAPGPGTLVLGTRGTTTMESVSTDEVQGNAPSGEPAVSADGRFVAFASSADNLVGPGGDTNSVVDVFVRDRALGCTERVSVESSGAQAFGGDSQFLGISADGRFVAFTSTAANLVPGDTNRVRDIFLRDRALGITERVSVDSAEVQGNDGSDGSPVITPDGRYVAFRSLAWNLAPNDRNNSRDIFLRDRATGTTELISVDRFGLAAGESGNPAITQDGRFVVFDSGSPNLVENDTNDSLDTLVRDRLLGTTVRVSVDSSGTEGNDNSAESAISDDGRFVAFASRATNLVPGDTNRIPIGAGSVDFTIAGIDAFVRDRDTDADDVFDEPGAASTERVSLRDDGTQGFSQLVGVFPQLSGDGRFVSFTSDAALVLDDTNGLLDAYVRDRLAGRTTRVSVASDGTQGNGSSIGHDISADGRFVAFGSNATNLVPNDTNFRSDAFLHDRTPPGTPTATATPTPTAAPTPTPTPSLAPAPTARKVTGGGEILGDLHFGPDGELLSPPAFVPGVIGGLQANFGFVARAGQPAEGNLVYHDDGNGTDIKATSFETLSISDGLCGPGTHAAFSGTAAVNGVGGQSFRVEVDDCADPGVFTDFFSIEAGTYSNSGRLLEGDIEVHR